MRTKLMILAIVGATSVTPSVASATKTCVDIYYQCLNDTWDTKGLARVLADLECAAKYAGCLRTVLQ